MSFEDIENVFTLFCIVVGLLGCLFIYIEIPKRAFLNLTVFFMAHFMSDYFWTVYQLVTGDYPEISEFAAYLGWNIAYLCLLLSVISCLRENRGIHFHPLMLWPFLTDIPLLILYLGYGGLFNNLWQVGITTVTMALCTGDIIHYFRNRRSEGAFPYFSILVTVYLVLGYVMWTASCFSWESELMNPYLYCTLLNSAAVLFLPWALNKSLRAGSAEENKKNENELRFLAVVHTVLSFVIFGVCICGYFLAVYIKGFVSGVASKGTNKELSITIFIISLALMLVVALMLYLYTPRFEAARKKHLSLEPVNIGRLNLIFTILITLVLMAFAVIYNAVHYYDISVNRIYLDADNVVERTAADLDNYLTTAQTTLRVAADTVDLIVQGGGSTKEISRYLTEQTTRQFEQFDENFTGIYAYVDGEYMDGSGWIPPEDYDPVTRDWYKTAVEADGELVIVSPYVDAQTGSVVITIAKMISKDKSMKDLKGQNVVCLDVIVNHVKDIANEVNIDGHGYCMVLNSDGFIIAHPDGENNGKNFTDLYGQELLNKIIKVNDGRIDTEMDGEECTLFVSPIMGQWVDVLVVDNSELLNEVHSQLFVSITVSVITFCLIAFFYYLGYRNELSYSKRMDEMNIQIVGALAAAIDAKDNYTNGHSSRVARYSRMIAERAGYKESRLDDIYMMGLLHDVGKIGVPDEVINKPARLTDEEFELIKKHPVTGSSILESIKEKPGLATGARWHHERYSGGGYPDGLKGDEIPEEARIIAVADAYDAMTSSRSYRAVMPQEKVRAEIEKGSGVQFDPKFAEIMLHLIDEDTDYSMKGV